MATSTRFSGAGARRQGYREGGDAPECTCAEWARPKDARRGAVFWRLHRPVRYNILPLYDWLFASHRDFLLPAAPV